MHLLLYLSCLSLALGDRLVIPEVQAAEASQLHDFSKYTAYSGPTGTAKALALAPTPKVLAQVLVQQATAAVATAAPYWYETIQHQGKAAFNTNSTYQVFRNVKTYGAKGDGKTDDTAAIQNAISDGNRCAPSKCASSTTLGAVVYFPAGTYIVSSSLLDYYNTQLIGNPNSLPILRATSTFSGLGIIDGDQYEPGNAAGVLGFGATNVFWRQVRNFVIDMTAIPASSGATGIHWPTAQATSLQNIVFMMSDVKGTQHQGLFIEGGSGGFMNDLVFHGGLKGAVFGNQQFTVRNLTFYNAVTAVSQIWNWGWTYKSININNCTTGLDMTNGGPAAQAVGSVTFLDSSFTNTKVAFNVSRSSSSGPPTGGSLTIENVALNNVPVAVQYGPSKSVYLTGTTGTTTIAGWKSGNSYTPNGPTTGQGAFTPPARPSSLVAGGKFYERSKPQYNTLPTTSFSSVRSGGAKGDGVTDDTTALQNVINSAASAGKVVFVDAGTYRVTKTILIPKGSKIVGESYSVIMSSGSFFSDLNNPQVVVQVGNAGDTGIVEWSDMIVSTQGAQAGAILIRWNLASTPAAPSGMWDVHTRIGGFTGSNLQVSQCPTTPSSSTINPNCVAAYMSMHVAISAAALYLENCWFWTADHDVDDPNLSQITVYTGRGLLVQSSAGTVWLVGTAIEHHALYQYQFTHTTNIFMGQIQTETPYYQPNPQAPSGFPLNGTIMDPGFVYYCPAGSPANCAMAYGLRFLDAHNVFVYGAGLYSFFNNYSLSCSNAVSGPGNGGKCQPNIFQYDSAKTTGIYIQNLNTIGATNMVSRDQSTVLAKYSDNVNVFPDTINLFRSN